MLKKILFVVLLIGSIGCARTRFNSVVGQPKSYAVDVLGVPYKSVTLEDGGEVWSYPTSPPTSTSSPVDRSPGAASPVVQGLAEGISSSIAYSIFGDGPSRYVYIDRSGRVTRWELRNW